MEKQIDFTGDWSNEYDATACKIIPGYHWIYELAEHLLRDNLDKEAKILVAGAGTGKEIIEFSQNNSHWSFTGVDPSKQMLSIAREKIGAAPLADRVSLVQGKIEDLKEKDFDAATSILVMQFLADDGEKLHFLKSIYEKLKPGGLLILVDLEGEIGSDAYNMLNGAWKNQQFFTRDENDRVGKEFKMREKEVHFIPQKRIESLLGESGFLKIHKFFQAYLFGAYIAQKK